MSELSTREVIEGIFADAATGDARASAALVGR